MSANDSIEMIASETVRRLFDADTLFQIAQQAIASYRADAGRSTTHLYRLCAQFYEAHDGREIGTLTVPIDPIPQPDPTTWQVWIGTREEIEKRMREHREQERAAEN